MPKIKILPESLSNKIAAGEVVERPASVVKELVENAIDAEATKITVEVEKGGRSLIRVADNGIGMSHDDALLALERYATSKIRNDRDLFAIRTMGFRGEALPSIAAVSKFTLVSRESTSDAGIQVEVEGGKINRVSDAGAPPGTMITVRQLFFNTPARRKFLKTINTEMGHIADKVAGVAMGKPGIHFILRHNGKAVRNWPATREAVERVGDVLGQEVAGRLTPVEKEVDGLTISGWVASPQINRGTTRGFYAYVNHRMVRDKMLQHALIEGFSGYLMKGRFPVAVLWIEVPYDQVDVNVHPTKNEVRFVRHRLVHDTLRDAVADALRTDGKTKLGSPSEYAEPYPSYARMSERKKHYGEVPGKTFNVLKIDGEKDGGSGVEPAGDADRRVAHPAKRNAQPETFDAHTTAALQGPIWQQKKFADLRIIGQFQNTYILCESDDGLICIDQHAAHERVFYEMLQSRSERLKTASQRLLVPETLELGFHESEVMNRLIPEFDGIGLEIEPFSGNVFNIRAVPELLAEQPAEPMVREIIEMAAETGVAGGIRAVVDESMKVMACHGAVRAHQSLTLEQVSGLMRQLDACRNPDHCPHGRPTWIRWTARELQKRFKRIV